MLHPSSYNLTNITDNRVKVSRWVLCRWFSVDGVYLSVLGPGTENIYTQVSSVLFYREISVDTGT